MKTCKKCSKEIKKEGDCKEQHFTKTGKPLYFHKACYKCDWCSAAEIRHIATTGKRFLCEDCEVERNMPSEDSEDENMSQQSNSSYLSPMSTQSFHSSNSDQSALSVPDHEDNYPAPNNTSWR